MTKRIEYIDVAKGIAVISIIAGHLKFTGSHGYDPIARFVFLYHVPVFFLIAGCFLSERQSLSSFVLTKAKRLLLPYLYTCVIMLTVVVGCRLVFGHSNPPTLFDGPRQFAKACLYGAGSEGVPLPKGIRAVGAIWYLEALFVALVEVRLCRRINHATGVAVFALAFIAIFTARKFYLPFAFQSGLFGGLYVYLGTLYQRFGLLERKLPSWLLFVLAFICVVGYYLDFNVSIARVYPGRYLLGVPVSLAASVLCLQFSKLIANHTKYAREFFTYFGANSLAIFCCHLMLLDLGFKWCLIQLTGIPYENTNMLFCINFPLQIVLTALFVRFARRDPLARIVFAYPSPKREIS